MNVLGNSNIYGSTSIVCIMLLKNGGAVMTDSRPGSGCKPFRVTAFTGCSPAMGVIDGRMEEPVKLKPVPAQPTNAAHSIVGNPKLIEPCSQRSVCVPVCVITRAESVI